MPLCWVLVRDRNPKEEFKTQALPCTDLDAKPERIISWVVRRWQMEVTFQEARRHLGFETRRQWSELWPYGELHRRCWGLFSLVTLFAHRRMTQAVNAFRQAAWYRKTSPTFADVLALVRKELWANETFWGSLRDTETVKVPQAFVEGLTDAVCYAA